MVAIDEAKTQPRHCAHRRALHKTSEFIGVAFFLITWLLQHFFSLPWPQHIIFVDHHTQWNIIVGGALVLVGIAGIAWVHRELGKHSQPHEPGRPTTQLVTTGPFAMSRNPTYLSCVVCLVPGMGLLTLNPWIFWLWPVSVLTFYWLMIREEEVYLQRQFGAEWETYCRTTRRWI